MQLGAKRWMKIILSSFALVVLAAVVVGVIYEQIGQQRDRKGFRQIGRSVDIGGRSLSIYCSGEGGPAVILDGGGNSPGYGSILLQARIAEFTRACWFDHDFSLRDQDSSGRLIKRLRTAGRVRSNRS